MAELIQLKRLKDLKIVGNSTTNGNITLDGVEKTVYTHPTTHSADIIVDGTINKAYTSIEKTKLSGITTGSTKVETSTTNGNVKINGVENNVYTQPLEKINDNWILNGSEYDIFITKENISDIILININNMNIYSGKNLNFNIILSDDIINIDKFSFLLRYFNYCGGDYTSNDRNIYIMGTDRNFVTSTIFSTKGSQGITNGYSTTVTIVKDKDNYNNNRYYIYDNSLELGQSLESKINNLSKSSVGLGYVPNVSTDNQTPTYTIASTNINLVSGEILSTAFGKIAKSISSLITHLADTVSHITSAERTTWNDHTTNTTKHITATERTNWNKDGTDIVTLKQYSIPSTIGTVSMTVNVGDTTKSVSVSHGLLFIPRVLVYVESLEDGVTFLKQLPLLYYDGLGITAKVSNNTITITYDRTGAIAITVPITYNFRYRVYYESL